MSRSKAWALIAILILAGIGAGGLYLTQNKGRNGEAPTPDEKQARPLRIGALLPLTGNVSALGGYMKNGIDLAVAQINATGGVLGKNVSVQYEDTKNDPKLGVSAINKLLSDPAVVANITSMTGVSNAVIPISDSRKKVIIATTASAPGLPDRSPYAFRLFVTAQLDAPVMARWAAAHLHLKNVAIMHVNDDFGRSFAEVFSKRFIANGGKATNRYAFDKKAVDFKDILTKVAADNPDGIYILGYGNNLGILPIQIREAGINAQILSIGTLAQPNVLKQASAALEGAYFTTTEFSPDTPGNKTAEKFARLYFEKYGKKANYFAAFAFDAVGLLAKAINSSNSADSEKIKQELLSTRNYKGVMGDISITPTGDAEFKMLVKKIHNGKVTDAI